MPPASVAPNAQPRPSPSTSGATIPPKTRSSPAAAYVQSAAAPPPFLQQRSLRHQLQPLPSG
eukprot:4839775-Pleurochrysis_carterae.AAC.1